MTKRNTREQATAARRDQIVGAAVDLLAHRGYQATTFDAISELAGLSSKRLITYHFSTKDELFAAIAAKVMADAEAFILPVVGAVEGPRQKLLTFIRTNVAFMASNMDQLRALDQIIRNGAQVWDGYNDASLAGLVDLFVEGQRVGEFRPFDTKVMAAALRGALDNMYPPLAAGLDPKVCGDELAEVVDRATRPA